MLTNATAAGLLKPRIYRALSVIVAGWLILPLVVGRVIDAEELGRPAELETVIIYTARMEEMAKFYRSGLQLPPFEASSSDHLGQRLGRVYLGFDRVDAVEGGYPGAVHLWFTVSDLEDAFERFVSLGARVRFPPTEKPWGAVLAAVYDPDGNILGLSQRQDGGGEESDGAE